MRFAIDMSMMILNRAQVRADVRGAYRRVDRDAAIMGSDPRALTLLCFDEFTAALASALHAHNRGLNDRRNDALPRASSALSALRVGIDPAQPIAATLTGLFDLADRSLRSVMVRFDPVQVATMAQDFAEIREAMAVS